MLHDLMPDVVTVSFGSRTKDIWSRLKARGLDFVGRGEWRGEPVLRVSDLAGRRKPAHATLSLHRGEVLGVAGLVGAGRTELLRAVCASLHCPLPL